MAKGQTGAEVEQSKAHGQSKWGAGGAEWSRGKKKSRVEWKQEKQEQQSGSSAGADTCLLAAKPPPDRLFLQH